MSGTPPDITISAEIDDLLLWFVVVWLIRQGLHCVEVFARVVNANLLFFNVQSGQLAECDGSLRGRAVLAGSRRSIDRAPQISADFLECYVLEVGMLRLQFIYHYGDLGVLQ